MSNKEIVQKAISDEVLDKCLKELQATESLFERMAIQDKYGISDEDICERCKNAMKYDVLNMCALVKWCKWDLAHELFRKERQPQNSRDCKNILDDECIRHSKSCSKDNHEKCMSCKHFEKEGGKAMTKESVENEIKRIHAEYEKEGGKGIKPSFNYIVVVDSSDDFFVTKTLSKAKDIAIVYGTEHKEFISIYEVKLFGNEYKANLIFTYKWHKRELVEDFERNPMHIAWRTRGDLLEVVDDSD